MVDCDSAMHARQASSIKTPSFYFFLSEFEEFLVHKFLSNQKRSLTAINLRSAMFSYSDDMRQPSASLTSGENKSVKHEIENRGKLESKLKANRRKKCKKKKTFSDVLNCCWYLVPSQHFLQFSAGGFILHWRQLRNFSTFRFLFQNFEVRTPGSNNVSFQKVFLVTWPPYRPLIHNDTLCHYQIKQKLINHDADGLPFSTLPARPTNDPGRSQKIFSGNSSWNFRERFSGKTSSIKVYWARVSLSLAAKQKYFRFQYQTTDAESITSGD